MGKKVMVAGHTCLDITPVFPKSGKSLRVDEVLCPGKLIQMEGVEIHTGGAVANTGLAMKILGAEVCLVGKTGKDAFGSIVAEVFGRYGAADGILAVEGERTSYSAVLALPGIDRIFLHDPGANDTFSFEDIRSLGEEGLKDVALFHFGYPPIMKKMYENEGEELLQIMKYMKRHGIATSLDLAAVDTDSAAGAADWKRILEKVLPYVDFFVPSIEELCFMLDRPRYEQWHQRAGSRDVALVLDPEQDIRPLAEECTRLGAKVILLKCGSPGLYYRTEAAGKLQELAEQTGICPEDWAGREGFEASYVPERVLSGTGAGDTTIAAFLTAMLEGYSFRRCIQLAAAQGACCVAAYDALSGLLSLKELNEKIEGGWEKNEKETLLQEKGI
ncbi:MAG: carbohydrate kinase family protein [Lachnospiraceae bacterium]|nr:carbohydrate kinase family protein [Lachnospiraceae bacterium]